MKMSFPTLPAGRRRWLAIAWATVGTLAAQVDLPPASLAAPTPAPQIRRPFFSPPDPPPLGTPLEIVPPAADARWPAPGELVDFVNEPFYAPLGVRLAEGSLSAAHRVQLDAYRAAKAALQIELYAQLDALKDSDAAARLRTLETFAREQTPRIAKLEEAAEQLRHDLADGLLSPGFDWNEYRRGLRVNQPDAAMRAAAFFLDGPSPAQRRLLREMALELAKPSQRPAGAPIPPSDATPVFFSPDLTRVRLPTNLPATLTAKVTAYAKEKAELKQELRYLIEAPGMNSKSEPLPRTLERFVQGHATRIDALEQLAEDIRRGLAQLPDQPAALGRLNLPPLTPELEARVIAYRRDKLDLQKALLARVEEATRRFGSPRTPVEKSKSGLGGAGSGQDEKIRQIIAAFTQENAARYAALEKSKEALRSDLARLAGTGTIVVKGPYADVLSKNFAEALQQLETWRNYRDYQVAVFEPGLSPEQRRLLFDLAVEKLALPLPAGEIQPDVENR